MSAVNPVVSLRPRAVEVECGGWVYTIPVLPAIDWIEAVLDPDGLAIFPGLMDDGGEAYEDVITGLSTGEITGEEVAGIARDALGAAAGRPWWVADKLIRSAMHPEVATLVHGRLKRDGFDFERESLGAFCDAVYALCVENLHEEGAKDRFDFQLSSPPAGVDIEQAMEGAEGDFMAALAADRLVHGGDIPTG